MKERDMRTECLSCTNKKEVPGNSHIACDDPDIEMVGSSMAFQKGWFFYPLLFDPAWKERLCKNYQSGITPVSEAISQAMSQATRG